MLLIGFARLFQAGGPDPSSILCGLLEQQFINPQISPNDCDVRRQSIIVVPVNAHGVASLYLVGYVERSIGSAKGPLLVANYHSPADGRRHVVGLASVGRCPIAAQ